MKKLLLPVFAVSAMLLNSCSTTQLARQADSGDDVYYTEAKAKVVEPAPARQQIEREDEVQSREEQTYRTDEQLYGGNDYSDRYDNDDEYYYSSRINRFYYNSPYRPYYDRFSYGYNPWYTYYDPFFYDPWMFRPGVSLWVNVGRYPRSYYNNFYGYYNPRFNNGYWGPYSYYNTYPGYGYGGYYGGGYYGNGSRYNTRSRPRPNREGGMGRTNDRIGSNDNGGFIPSSGRPSRGSSIPRDNSGSGRISSDPSTGGTTSQPSGSSARPTRGSNSNRNNESNGDRISSTPGTGSSQPSSTPAREPRPSRTRDSGESSERRQSAPPSRPAPEFSRPERTYTPPPSSSGRSSDGGGSSSSGSSGGSSSSGGGRPSRGR